MQHYASNITVPDLARRILAASRIMITTHVKPDGDAMGSALALARALSAKQKMPRIFLAGPIEPGLLTIAGTTEFSRLGQEMPDDNYDLALVVDTGAWSQLEQISPWLKKNYKKVAVIDHHTRGDDVGAARLIEPRAVSTTAMLIPLLDEMKCDLKEPPGSTGGAGSVAEALFVGLATDSGWFRYGNAGVEAFQLAARLLECGVNKDRLYQILEETFGPQRLALEARALASLEYAHHGKVAIQSLHAEDFKRTGATPDDVTGLVNTPMTVGMVRVSILLTQFPDASETKMSFRSKPPPPDGDASDFVDVNVLANRFGGGGHVHAAGARMKKNLDETKAAVLAAIAEL